MTGDSNFVARLGTVFWITGLSGSGKTTIGKLLFQQLREHCANSVFLDGDDLRMVFENGLGYSLSDRKICARRYSRLGRLLAEQGTHVVLPTISMFQECRNWNRQHIRRYCEIYVRNPLSLLVERNQKGLYSGSGVKEVVGLDLPFEEPLDPDLIVDSDGSMCAREAAEWIWGRIQKWL